jgi:hypothetical protein
MQQRYTTHTLVSLSMRVVLYGHHRRSLVGQLTTTLNTYPQQLQESAALSTSSLAAATAATAAAVVAAVVQSKTGLKGLKKSAIVQLVTVDDAPTKSRNPPPAPVVRVCWFSATVELLTSVPSAATRCRCCCCTKSSVVFPTTTANTRHSTSLPLAAVAITASALLLSLSLAHLLCIYCVKCLSSCAVLLLQASALATRAPHYCLLSALLLLSQQCLTTALAIVSSCAFVCVCMCETESASSCQR